MLAASADPGIDLDRRYAAQCLTTLVRRCALPASDLQTGRDRAVARTSFVKLLFRRHNIESQVLLHRSARKLREASR